MNTPLPPPPAESLAEAQAALAALEAEAATLPARLMAAAGAGDAAQQTALATRQAVLPHLIAAAREEVQALRLPDLDAQIAALEEEQAAAGADYAAYGQQVEELQRQIEAVRRSSQPAYDRLNDARYRLQNRQRQRAELVRELGLTPAAGGVAARGANQVIPARQWRDDPRLSSGGAHIIGA